MVAKLRGLGTIFHKMRGPACELTEGSRAERQGRQTPTQTFSTWIQPGLTQIYVYFFQFGKLEGFLVWIKLIQVGFCHLF